MTPAEYARYMLAWTRRRKEQTKADQTLAYNIAALVGNAMKGKLKKFEQVFPDKKEISPRDKEELKRDFKKFSNFLKTEREKKKNG